MLIDLATIITSLGSPATVKGDRIIIGAEVIRCTLVGYVIAENSTSKVILGSTAHDATTLAHAFISNFR